MHVDIRTSLPGGEIITIGSVRLDRSGRAVPDRDLGPRFDSLVVVEPGIGRVLPEEGERYLRALQQSLRGTYAWATASIDDPTEESL